ncbi:hypothetical protein E2562_001930 [Oryza meyeriana var. granulata]|uniref:Uncharacterized protein n=1 Tax=Oryza meyeriana var. granulata TaxID=110450 RepID=A0A6G1C485_9ORYZ|nr:hypothetical protein E2562_001930 [Oryza meyeriana var. granulata]
MEMRALAARIVADLAGGIRLAQFPGLSSLVETTGQRQPLWNKANHRMKEDNRNGIDSRGDAHNCRDICNAPGLLAKITAPLYSATLIQDIGSSEPWADVANASLKVVHQLLIHAAPGETLPHEIFSDEHAVSSLESILDLAGSEQLQMRAIDILTELLVKKQLEIFPADGREAQVTAATNPNEKTIKATAGETPSMILPKTEALSGFIKTEHVDRLILMLDGKEKISYRTISAKILESVCIHYKQQVKETSLHKVFAEILKIPEIKTSRRTISATGYIEETRGSSSKGDDVEKQRRPKRNRKKAQDKASDQQANEDEADIKDLQEALLSMTLVICDNLFPEESSAHTIQENAAPDGEFLEKLKRYRRRQLPVSVDAYLSEDREALRPDC